MTIRPVLARLARAYFGPRISDPFVTPEQMRDYYAAIAADPTRAGYQGRTALSFGRRSTDA